MVSVGLLIMAACCQVYRCTRPGETSSPDKHRIRLDVSLPLGLQHLQPFLLVLLLGHPPDLLAIKRQLCIVAFLVFLPCFLDIIREEELLVRPRRLNRLSPERAGSGASWRCLQPYLRISALSASSRPGSSTLGGWGAGTRGGGGAAATWGGLQFPGGDIKLLLCPNFVQTFFLSALLVHFPEATPTWGAAAMMGPRVKGGWAME